MIYNFYKVTNFKKIFNTSAPILVFPNILFGFVWGAVLYQSISTMLIIGARECSAK